MTDGPDRDRLIELLDKLGGDSDEDVLAAARRVHAMVDETGSDWDDLLAPPASDTPVEADDLDDEADDADVDADEEDAKPREGGNMDDAQSVKLIDTLLGRPEISEFLREELEGYKEDIAEGDFTASDRTYLHALNARLKKIK